MTSIPPRPQGPTPFHKWAQWVHDTLANVRRGNESPDALTSRTTKGTFVQPRSVKGGGATTPLGDWFKGLYDADTTYNAQQVVAYTPSGGQAGMYVCLMNNTLGITPDTGAPNWFAWLYPAPGVWST